MTSAEQTAPGADRSSTEPVRRRGVGILVVIAALVVSALVFGNSISGDFVYDDAKQIVDNPLIKDNRLLLKALTSDVWAFKGNTEWSWSNYWRPTFIGWLVVNERLFGVGDPRGWHVTNILLHAGVVALVWFVVRGLGAGAIVSTAIALLFAVHPVHVESVAWVSGSPDLLLGVALLGSYASILPIGRRMTGGRWALSAALYSAALLSKEVAILFPLIVFCSAALLTTAPRFRSRLTAALRLSVPFALLAGVYLIVRVIVLGQVQQAQASGATWVEMLATWPSIGVFYLRQVFWPLTFGPSYPIRVVSGDAGIASLAGPLGILLAVGVVLLLLARRNTLCAIGLAIAVLLLAPAGNIRVFTPEQLVHDRYLYLPVLGLLMCIVPALSMLLMRMLGERSGSAATLAVAILISAPLAWKTIAENATWRSEVALWERGVESDPQSMFNHTQLGVFLNEAGRVEDAVRALDRAIDLMPLPDAYQPNAYLERAEIAVNQRRFAAAQSDLETVLAKYPAHFGALERLAVCFERQQRLPDAERVLRMARERIPYRRCELTDRLAVVLHQQGRRAEALAELESVRGEVEAEFGPMPKLVLFHLGMLQLEMGNRDRGVSELRRYLELTNGAGDDLTRRFRAAAQQQAGR